MAGSPIGIASSLADKPPPFLREIKGYRSKKPDFVELHFDSEEDAKSTLRKLLLVYNHAEPAIYHVADELYFFRLHKSQYQILRTMYPSLINDFYSLKSSNVKEFNETELKEEEKADIDVSPSSEQKTVPATASSTPPAVPKEPEAKATLPKSPAPKADQIPVAVPIAITTALEKATFYWVKNSRRVIIDLSAVVDSKQVIESLKKPPFNFDKNLVCEKGFQLEIPRGYFLKINSVCKLGIKVESLREKPSISPEESSTSIFSAITTSATTSTSTTSVDAALASSLQKN